MKPRPPSDTTQRRMKSIRQRDTNCEMILRRELFKRGLRYRVNTAPEGFVGQRADIVFPRQRVAIFVDGCFWHRCPTHGSSPRHNRDWWDQKLSANCERDRRNTQCLESKGWRVLRIWEHEDAALAADAIESLLASPK